MLYPIKLIPFYKEMLWGGRELASVFGRELPDGTIGESWEVAAIGDDISVVGNGFFAGNNLEEMSEIYMDELLGEKVYKKYGYGFPLLVKLIDAQQNLSVQVHPDDTMAQKRHMSYGKTEMWYVVDAKPGAKLYVGFNQPVDRVKFEEYLSAGKLEMLLREYPVVAGDAFFIPAGTIHAIGAGVLIAEVQQSSDITYRVYDYNRVDKDGNSRELHTDFALDTIDFEGGNLENFALSAKKMQNEFVELITCDYFCTNILGLSGEIRYDYSTKDSFVILMCVSGSLSVCYGSQGGEVSVGSGESVLLPAVLGDVVLRGTATVLTTYIP